MDIRLLPLGKLTHPEIAPFLEPELRQWVKKPQNREDLHLMAAVEKERILGLLVVHFIPETSLAHIESLVAEDIKIKERLLREVDGWALKEGALKLTGEFNDGKEIIPILKKLGWSAPTKRYENLFIDIRTFNAPWYMNPPSLPKGFSLVRWDKIPPSDLALLDKMGEDDRILISESDRNFEVEPLNSLLLKHGDEIVGWMENGRLDPETIYYCNLFVFPKWRHKRVAIPLLSASMHLQAESPLPGVYFELDRHSTPKSWQNFVAKRLRPYTIKTYFTLYSNKLLDMI